DHQTHDDLMNVMGGQLTTPALLPLFEHAEKALEEELGDPRGDQDVHAEPDPPSSVGPDKNEVVLVDVLVRWFELVLADRPREQQAQRPPHPREAGPAQDPALLILLPKS